MWSTWFRRMIVLMLVCALWRVGFWAFNRPPGLELADLLKAFALGARFDLSVAAYAASLPLLFVWFGRLLEVFGFSTALPSHHLRPLANGWWTFVAWIIAATSMIEIGYYSFYQDRFNVLLFGFVEDDTWALIKTLWKNYPIVWMVLTIWIAASVTASLLRRRAPARVRPTEWTGRLSALGAVTALFLLNGMIARGSVGLFPLSEMDTHISKTPFINLLSYNPIHALSRATQNKLRSQERWNSNLVAFGYQDPRQAWADCFDLADVSQVPADPLTLLRRKTPVNNWAREIRPHVVVLVMESLGATWLSYDREPFDLVGALGPRLKQGPALTRFFSGTAATIGSLSSLMSGVPHRPFSDFLTEGENLGTRVRTAPALTYKNAGYKTRFVYAGNPGWRDIGKYSLTQGFDRIVAEGEIEQALGRPLARHDWGLYDEDVWDYVRHELASATSPQFLLVMTTANHPPYTLPPGVSPAHLDVPEDLDARLVGDKQVARQRFQTFRHSNDVLGKFLDDLDASPEADRTVVAVTGDHSFWVVNFSETEQLQKNSVPLLFRLPKSVNKSFPTGMFGTHTDLWPTIYNLTLSEGLYDSLSQDLFDPAGRGWALNSSFLILGAEGGVLVGTGGREDSPLAWDGHFEQLRSTAATPAVQAMAKRYRCVMSVVDDLFHREKKRSEP